MKKDSLLACLSVFSTVFFTLTSNVAYADVTGQIQQFMGTQAFAASFHVGDSIVNTYKNCQLSCDAISCAQACDNTPLTDLNTVTAVDGNSANVQDSSGTVAILKSDFDSVQGDLALNFIQTLPQNIGLDASVSLSSATPTTFVVSGNSIPSLIVKGRMVTSQNQSADFSVTIAQQVPAIAQVLDVVIMGSHWSTVTSLKP